MSVIYFSFLSPPLSSPISSLRPTAKLSLLSLSHGPSANFHVYLSALPAPCTPPLLSLPPSRAGLLCGGSLVPLGGHYWSPEECFRPQAEAVRSGVASPSTPDLQKLSAARSGTANKMKWVHSSNPHVRPLFVSPHLHASLMRPFFGALFWWSLSEPLGGLVPFHVCFDANRTEGEGHTVYPVPGTADCLAVWPESLHYIAGARRGPVPSPWVLLAFAKGQLLLWPNRWHFQTVKIRLQRSQVAFTRAIAESWGFRRKHKALKSTARWKDEIVF